MHSSVVSDLMCQLTMCLCAAAVVRHCQNEVTAGSITLAAALFEHLCIRDGSYSIEFEDSIIIDYIESICRH